MNKIPVKLVIGIALALCFSISLFIRVYFPYSNVFSDGLIKFTGVDAYYFMRLVDNLVHNFPHSINFDAYFTFPAAPGDGQIGFPPFFPWILAGIIWLVGLGSPSEHTIDIVGVYFPAVLAALSVIPVYFIGKALFGRRAGLIAAALLAIMPGEFLGRSILGFTDYHIAEMLFTTTAMMFLILAIKASYERGLTIDHLRNRDWATAKRPLTYSLLAGIFLGIYFITWPGALLFAFIIVIYLIIQSVINHLRRESTDYLGLAGFIVFTVALAIYALVWRKPLATFFLGISLLIPIGLTLISRVMAGRNIRLAYYPLVLVGLGAAAMAIIYVVNPAMIKGMLAAFSVFTPSGLELTTLEMQPLLAPRGELSPGLGWGNFTTSFFLFPPDPRLPGWMHYFPGLGLIALGVLIGIYIYQAVKQGDMSKGWLLLIIWSLVMLLAMLGQRRFAYYFVANIAVLSGFVSWQIIRLSMKTHPTVRCLNIALSALMIIYLIFYTRFNPAIIGVLVALFSGYMLWQLWQLVRGSIFPIESRINIALAALIVSYIVIVPNISAAISVARQTRFAPTDGWVSSLTWLRENTPEPFSDPNAYYQLYQPPLRGGTYKYPESAYAVASWWDYGYWIMRIARRLPHSSPGSSSSMRANTAHLFLSPDEASAEPIIEEMGAKYLTIDHLTTINKFSAIAQWTGMQRSQFFDTYILRQEERTVRVLLYYPEYYRSLAVRLYNFDGQAVVPMESVVVTYEEQEGMNVRMITSAEVFDTYEEAAAFLAGKEQGNPGQKQEKYRIVGVHPFGSPVPLEALKQYKLIHSSEVTELPNLGVSLPEVKTFEYIGN